jgi:hypothetical protein
VQLGESIVPSDATNPGLPRGRLAHVRPLRWSFTHGIAPWSQPAGRGPGMPRSSGHASRDDLRAAGLKGRAAARGFAVAGRAYPARWTMYCSILPSGSVMVVRPITTLPARIRYERIVIPPRSDWPPATNSLGAPSGPRLAA